MPLDQVDVDKIEQKETPEMSFLEHLEELRWHIIRSTVVITLVAIGVYVGIDWIFRYVINGPRNEWFPTYRLICSISETLCFYPPKLEMVAVEFGEQFIISIKVSLLLSIIIAFPYIFWEIWRFIKPGLYDKERKAARGIVLICTGLFFSGVSFGYFIISPFAVTFLGNYTLGEVVNTPTLASYINYMTMFTLPVGLVFELPIVVYFLAKIGLLYPDFMRTYRRHALVIILIAAAVITPPDAITQMLIGLPLYILYEISIHICQRVVSKAEEASL